VKLRMLLRPNSRQKAEVRYECVRWALLAHARDADPFQILATAQLFEEYILEGRAGSKPRADRLVESCGAGQ
jgi:hypothetical protein